VLPLCHAWGKLMFPTNGRIFPYTLSQYNVQCMTAYFSSRYLVKYIAGIDKGNVIYVVPGNDYTGSRQNITLELVLHSNFYHALKVAGSKINIKAKETEAVKIF
jgi:hypothetical protein